MKALNFDSIPSINSNETNCSWRFQWTSHHSRCPTCVRWKQNSENLSRQSEWEIKLHPVRWNVKEVANLTDVNFNSMFELSADQQLPPRFHFYAQRYSPTLITIRILCSRFLSTFDFSVFHKVIYQLSCESINKIEERRNTRSYCMTITHIFRRLRRQRLGSNPFSHTYT